MGLAEGRNVMATDGAGRLQVFGMELEALRRGAGGPMRLLLGFQTVDPVGIKISGPETPDILDVFEKSPDEVRRRSWHDPDRFAPDFNGMSDEALTIYARNREALCLYAWHPYMYNPQLPRWLGRIKVPTLVLWGESDRVVTPDYGRAYSRLIPGSRFEVIERAGHHPEIEQPEIFVERVSRFLEE